jgi:hypothetical protein
MERMIWSRLYDNKRNLCGVIVALGETGKVCFGTSICRGKKIIDIGKGKIKTLYYDKFNLETGLALAYYKATFKSHEFAKLNLNSAKGKEINRQIDNITKRAKHYFKA